MAEAAKILNPTKKVVLPDTLAGCSLADGCSGEGLRKMREQHPGALVATYINCNAETKAESDIIVTSSNAETIIKFGKIFDEKNGKRHDFVGRKLHRSRSIFYGKNCKTIGRKS